MLSISPESQEGDPLLKVLSDWPKDWDAAFTLLAQGAFVVSSVQRGVKNPFVEIQSQAGKQCRLVNPWQGRDVTLYRNGKKAEDYSGETLTFTTRKGETVVVVPKGSTPSSVKVL